MATVTLAFVSTSDGERWKVSGSTLLSGAKPHSLEVTVCQSYCFCLGFGPCISSFVGGLQKAGYVI